MRNPGPRLQSPLLGGQSLREVCEEVNRLRKRDGLDHDLGPLAVAHKVFAHFHSECNPRVAEALENVGKRGEAKSP